MANNIAGVKANETRRLRRQEGNDIVIVCRDYREYRDRQTGQKVVTNVPQNVHFHMKFSCVLNRYPHFQRNWLVIPRDIVPYLSREHFERLTVEFNWIQHWHFLSYTLFVQTLFNALFSLSNVVLSFLISMLFVHVMLLSFHSFSFNHIFTQKVHSLVMRYLRICSAMRKDWCRAKNIKPKL